MPVGIKIRGRRPPARYVVLPRRLEGLFKGRIVFKRGQK